tara:strand:- start:2110 stop:2601 length:492 start_codon:yes stop_codon:yes gene_type:complete
LTERNLNDLYELVEGQYEQIKLLTRAVNTYLDVMQTQEQSPAVRQTETILQGHPSNTLYKLTTKQHGALQMLLDGCSNSEIAKRFDVSEDTAKVYVRTIAKKYEVNTRAQIVMATLEEFNSLDDDVYMRISGGLPKDWHSNFQDPDPFAELYRTKKHEPKPKT